MQKTNHRILLIEPPYYRLFKDTYSLERYPLSLGYLAGAIKSQTDWDVTVYNADFTPQSEEQKVSYLAARGFYNYLESLKDLSKPIWKDVKSIISEYGPSVVGISAKSQNYTSACIVAKFIKELDKNIIVIIGGPHPSCVGSKVLDCPDIDVCVRGEGENTIVELLNAIEAQKEFDGIRGTIYRRNGRVIENPVREFINDLDSLAFPYEDAPYVLKDYSRYPLMAFQHIFATRGCPYHCFFCASRKVWSRDVRFRSPLNVIREIKGLQEKGLESIAFADDTFGIKREYIKDLCSALIKDCPGLNWKCEMHVKLVDEEIISLMKKAGCFSIVIGIESGNNGILREMRKGFTIEEALSACKIIEKHSIRLETFFMVGFPQETESTLMDTVKAMKKIKNAGLTYSIFTPYPGTEAFEFCKNKGLIDDNYDISLYNHQSPANCFCLNMTPERFRRFASKIEKMVDTRYRLNNIRQAFSSSTISKIKKKGVVGSIKSAVRIFQGR